MSLHTIRLAAAVIVPLTVIAPAFACDPEDLKAEYRNLCATPTDAIAALVEAAANRLLPAAANLLVAKVREAKALCQADQYDDAMRLAVRVARALGAAEQAAGLPREEFTQAPSAGSTPHLAQK